MELPFESPCALLLTGKCRHVSFILQCECSAHMWWSLGSKEDLNIEIGSVVKFLYNFKFLGMLKLSFLINKMKNF